METGHEKGGAPCGRALQNPQHCRATQSRLAPAFADALFLLSHTNSMFKDSKAIVNTDVEFTVEIFVLRSLEPKKWVFKNVCLYVVFCCCVDPNLTQNPPDQFRSNLQKPGF